MGREIRVAEGVSLRRSAAGEPESLRIAFYFRGVECRERLRLAPTKPNIAFAERLRGEIVNAIGRNDFNYADYAIKYFARDDNAKRFGFTPTGKLVGDALTEYEAIGVESVEASTWSGYQKIIDRCLRPWFAHIALRDLTAGMIEEELLESGVVLKTARNILSVLNMALRCTRSPNPVGLVDLEVIWPRDRRKSEWEADPFAFEEMAEIFGACRDEEEADYWRTAFGSGMRPSEQIELQWPRVQQYRIRIEEARVLGLNGDVLKGPKTSAGNRWIDLTAGAYEALQRQRERTGAQGKHVFLDARYGKPWTGEQALRKRWERILKKAEVRYRNPYQTRHTFGSTMLAAGHAPLRVAAWMGHEGPEMLYRHYARWIEQGSNPATRAALAAFYSHPAPTEAKIIALSL